MGLGTRLATTVFLNAVPPFPCPGRLVGRSQQARLGTLSTDKIGSDIEEFINRFDFSRNKLSRSWIQVDLMHPATHIIGTTL